MLRAAGALIVATWFVFQVRAENTIPPLNLNWFTATVPNNPPSKTPPAKPPLAIPVQEPYCEYGVGPCGGTCLEEGENAGIVRKTRCRAISPDNIAHVKLQAYVARKRNISDTSERCCADRHNDVARETHVHDGALEKFGHVLYPPQ